MIKIKLLLILLVGCFSYTTTAATKVMDVGLIEQGRQPYFTPSDKDDKPQGMYIDILDAISSKTGIQFRYQFLPQARIRMYLKIGMLDIEPGIAPEWRKESGEQEISIYSDVLFSSQEVLAYNSSVFSSTPDARTLMANYRPCKLLGFNELEPSNDTHSLTSEQQLLELIRIKRCDWAIFPLDVLKRTSTYKEIAYTKPVANYHLRLRLHNKNTDYLEMINMAIQSMQKSGELSSIINSYSREKK